MGLGSRPAQMPPACAGPLKLRGAGELLGKLERSVSWWLGDWWAFGEKRYGERKAIVEDEGWDGPDYGACRNAGSIAGGFELSRRRDSLTFKHHAEVAALPPDVKLGKFAEFGQGYDTRGSTTAVTNAPRATTVSASPASSASSQSASDTR